LEQIHEYAFNRCFLLRSILLPASLKLFDGSCFVLLGISSITGDGGNQHLQARGDFLLDFRGISLIRYFGSHPTVTIPREIEMIGRQFTFVVRIRTWIEADLDWKAMLSGLQIAQITLHSSLCPIDRWFRYYRIRNFSNHC
jgi:hypothetical protein